MQDLHFLEARMAKIMIEPGSVQETLIIPLYGRKLCAEIFPELYRDKSAACICASIDYDFTDLDQQAQSTLWKFGALEAAMRQLDMQWEIHDYLACHPQCAAVNMGCGLDQTGRACDNGGCHIYNVDMPDIIKAHVSRRGYMLGYYDMADPSVTRLHRFLARRCDGLVKMRIVRMDFAGKPGQAAPTQGGEAV